jgi:ubiquinone/menaquinone biosynthesis C-methylase UbiE
MNERHEVTEDVRRFWENEACGTSPEITGDWAPLSQEWFSQIEQHRYRVEPYIHSVAQFTRHRGKAILEIGVGAGTDHLQWARAGCRCHGVDLTDTGIETTRAHLRLYGFDSDLRRVNAEALPFPDASFDIVWSWGVIHHANDPSRIIAEIHRVLKPGGSFLGMMYRRWSATLLRLWVRRALLDGRPWRTLNDVIWHHFESKGTKAYTHAELHELFALFRNVEVTPILTSYDGRYLPTAVARNLPAAAGMFAAIRAEKTEKR